MENVYALATQTKHFGVTPQAAIANEPCDPIGLSGPIDPGPLAPDWELQAVFVLGAGYADSRSAPSPLRVQV